MEGTILNKLIKILSLFVFLILTSTFFHQQVYAENQNITTPTEGTLSTNANFGMGSINPIDVFANSYLVAGNSSIRILGGKLTVSGDTLSKVVADQVTVRLTVQYRNSKSGQWVDLVSGGNYSRTNTTYVSGKKTINASPGYQYRIRAYHLVKNNGKAEQAYSYSNIIEIK